jgi:uncharacterized protein
MQPGAISAAAPIASAVAPEQRVAPIDVLRGIALLGVLTVNLMNDFRVSIFQQILGISTARGESDRLVERVIALGFSSKALCLFSLLFGVGLAIQFGRLSRYGHPLYWLSRRLAVLLAFGLIHLLFIWNGDILTEYAIAGLLVLPPLLVRSWVLWLATLALLALYAAGPVLLYSIPYPDSDTMRAHVALANQVYPVGSLAEIWRFSLGELRLVFPFHIFVFPRTLALFLLGALLWRSGMLERLAEFKYRMLGAAVVGIGAGAAMMAADAYGFLAEWLAVRSVAANLAPVVLALGYGAAVLGLTQLPVTRRALSAFAPIGRMAFTNYLMQSLILGFIFFGYGLGQFGRMGATPAFALGIAVYILQMLFSAWWLRRYRFGPVEWLWRTLMYGAAQPMRVARSYSR